MSINNALIATFAIVLLLFEVILPFIRYQLYNTMYIYIQKKFLRDVLLRGITCNICLVTPKCVYIFFLRKTVHLINSFVISLFLIS